MRFFDKKFGYKWEHILLETWKNLGEKVLKIFSIKEYIIESICAHTI